jgi:hypothetical protein
VAHDLGVNTRDTACRVDVLDTQNELAALLNDIGSGDRRCEEVTGVKKTGGRGGEASDHRDGCVRSGAESLRAGLPLAWEEGYTPRGIQTEIRQ